MGAYAQQIMNLRSQYEQAEKLKAQVDALVTRLQTLNEEYAVFLEAQQLLATVSNNNTTAVLDYITGIINKALGELFPFDTRRVYLEKKLYNGQHAHINVKLVNGEGIERDIQLQSGTGLRQVISFLFVVSLIEVRKGRRLLIMDELLSGLHPHAKNIVFDVIKIFAEEGFQFVIVEYGVNDFGKIYIAEKPNKDTTITPLEGEYNDEVFIFNRPVENVDKSIQVEEYDDEEEVN